MNLSYVKSLKRSSILFLALVALFSCQKEIENIGVDLINEDKISDVSLSKKLQANTQKVENVLASGGLGQYLLGVYSKDDFGTLQTDLVSQVKLPAYGDKYTYGKTPIIDSVLITIPYQSTTKGKQSDGKPKYQLDSVFGNKQQEFKINVHRLKTFLNTLDPENPAKAMIYKSNKNFDKEETTLYSGAFKANANDTIAYIKRYDADKKLYRTDTLKEDKSKPFMSIPLNKTQIQKKLVDVASSGNFASQNDFNHYFKGLYIASEIMNSNNSHIVSLDFKGAKMRIFYSNLVDESDSQDLNKNGVKGEKDVRVPKSYSFNLEGIKSNVYRRSNYNLEDTKRLYVQGAAGAIVLTDPFSNLDIEEMRKTPKLITQANLVFYVDQDKSSSDVPKQLFIYNYDKSEKIVDLLYTNKTSSIGGNLEKTDDGKPYRYVFRITRHIAELLKNTKENSPKLAIKTFNVTDISNKESKSVLNYNWNPKGVVLHGVDSEIENKRPTFEINYSKLGN